MRSVAAALISFLVANGAMAKSLPPLREVSIAGLFDEPPLSADATKDFSSEAMALAVEDRREEFRKLGLSIRFKPHYLKDEPMSPFYKLEEVMKSDAVAAVGFGNSDQALVAAPLLKNSSLLVVSPYATSTAILSFEPNLLMFAASNAELAKSIETFINTSLKPKRLTAVVAWDSAYSQNLYTSLSEEFRSHIKLIKTTEAIQDIKTLVKMGLADSPDAILIPNSEVNTATLIKVFSEEGFKGVFVGPETWGEATDNRFKTLTAGAPFLGYSIRQFSRFKISAAEERLTVRLDKSIARQYSTIAGLYYDSTNYVLDLIKLAAADVGRQQILTLSKTHRKHNGLTGPACLSTAICPGRTSQVVRIKNGAFKYERSFALGVSQP